MNMSIRKFIMDEVERQGWERGSSDFWFRIGAMSAAWRHAIGAYASDVPEKPTFTVEQVRLWGMLVEPEVNAEGWRTCRIFVGGHEGAPWEEIPRLMAAWSGAVTNGRFAGPDEAYLEFEKIHPFRDGNGRTGKIIHNWLLGTLEEPVLIKDYFGGGVP